MLSILVVNWNTRDYLRTCLSSLLRTCDGQQHEVIVVDNASVDGSAAMVEAEFPWVRLVSSGANLGFAAGNNLAYSLSSGDFVWLLNPDTQVLDGAPAALLEFLGRDPQRGAAASALVDARSGRVQQSCRTFPTPGALWVEAAGLARAFPRSRRYGFYRMGWWRYHDCRQVEQPMASSLMLRRAAINAAGGLFDEQFPIFFNDVDLCWRLRETRQQVWYLPEARVLHYGGAATGQVQCAMIAESHRSLRRFYHKHYRGSVRPVLYNATTALISLGGAVRTAACLLRRFRRRLEGPKSD